MRCFHPGVLLNKNIIQKFKLDFNCVAADLGVSVEWLLEFCNGEHRLTVDFAFALASATGTDESYWLRIQYDYEVATVRKRMREKELSKRTTPHLPVFHDPKVWERNTEPNNFSMRNLNQKGGDVRRGETWQVVAASRTKLTPVEKERVPSKAIVAEFNVRMLSDVPFPITSKLELKKFRRQIRGCIPAIIRKAGPIVGMTPLPVQFKVAKPFIVVTDLAEAVHIKAGVPRDCIFIIDMIYDPQLKRLVCKLSSWCNTNEEWARGILPQLAMNETSVNTVTAHSRYSFLLIKEGDYDMTTADGLIHNLQQVPDHVRAAQFTPH